MEDTNECYLLSLPRELRNMIYDHVITEECDISERGPPHEIPPQIILLKTVHLPMLLLNHQIQEEYLDHILARPELIISYLDTTNLSVGCVLQSNAPLPLLKRVRSCRLQVSWEDMLYHHHTDVAWFRRLAEERFQQQELLPWTPSKGIRCLLECIRLLSISADYEAEMRHRLEEILSKLHDLVSESTRVHIDIDIAGLPDPSARNFVGLSSFPTEDVEDAKHYSRMFHPQTLAKLQSDHTIPWPEEGNLTVMFSVKTPLSALQRTVRRKSVPSTSTSTMRKT